MTMGVLFENKSQKYLTLIPGNARFTSSADEATRIEKHIMDDPFERNFLLDHHNIDWHARTIEWRPVDETADTEDTTPTP
jgi:hypothetical protein